jgi:hypothetical protein
MHVPSVDMLISEIDRTLISEGIAVVSMANKLSLYVMWTTKINNVLVNHQKLYYRDQFTFWSFRKLLVQHGFKILSSRGFAIFPPISLKSEWHYNIINPFMSRILSRPFDRMLGRYFGCGVTFIIKKK